MTAALLVLSLFVFALLLGFALLWARLDNRDEDRLVATNTDKAWSKRLDQHGDRLDALESAEASKVIVQRAVDATGKAVVAKLEGYATVADVDWHLSGIRARLADIEAGLADRDMRDRSADKVRAGILRQLVDKLDPENA